MVENRIKTVRKENGMTQAELAKASGITRTMICFLETGKKKDCKLSTMEAISKALRRPVAEIFLGSEITDVSNNAPS